MRIDIEFSPDAPVGSWRTAAREYWGPDDCNPAAGDGAM
jgi:hypothetical protein